MPYPVHPDEVENRSGTGPWSSQHPSFAAGSYVVNGRAASPAEAQHLVASGVQPGAWVVNGYGIAPAAERAVTARLPLKPAPEVLLRPRRAALRLTDSCTAAPRS
jgi:hypothetical protein